MMSAVGALARSDGDGDDGDAENEEAQALLRARQMAMGVSIIIMEQQQQPAAAPAAAAEVERDAAAELAAHLDLICNLTLEDSSDQCIAKKIDSLQGIRIVGASAGHRHSLLLDAQGYLYSFGAGSSGCLGHGDTAPQMFPCRIQAFDEDNVRIRQMSAGVDMSMAVSTTGHVYAFGKTDGGRIGLGMAKSVVTLPRRVYFGNYNNDKSSSDKPNDDDHPSTKAVDVECGYVHSLIVGLNGTIHLCGGVGVDGEADGQQREEEAEGDRKVAASSSTQNEGRPRMVDDFNIWHRIPEPREHEPVKKERWKKYGKYEVKGRSKNV